MWYLLKVEPVSQIEEVICSFKCLTWKKRMLRKGNTTAWCFQMWPHSAFLTTTRKQLPTHFSSFSQFSRVSVGWAGLPKKKTQWRDPSSWSESHHFHSCCDDLVLLCLSSVIRNDQPKVFQRRKLMLLLKAGICCLLGGGGLYILTDKLNMKILIKPDMQWPELVGKCSAASFHVDSLVRKCSFAETEIYFLRICGSSNKGLVGKGFLLSKGGCFWLMGWEGIT